MDSDFIKDYTLSKNGQYITLICLNCIAILIYLATLGMTIYNVVVFLIGQKRYRAYTVSMFYLFAVGVLITRIIEYVIASTWFVHSLSHGFAQNSLAQIYAMCTENYALSMIMCQIMGDTLKTSLGFFPVASMLELGLRLSGDWADAK